MKELIIGEIGAARVIEALKLVKVPEKFSRRSISAIASFLNQDESLSERPLKLDLQEKEVVSLIADLLDNSEFDSLIEKGKVTLALIKPSAHRGIGLPDNDLDAAEFLLQEIGSKAFFSFSTIFSKVDVEKFYAPIREKYNDSEHKIEGSGTVWDSIVRFTSGLPITVVFIYDEGGNAVEWWRAKMGHTRADRATHDSIRGKYAQVANLPNNLVHGSDAVGSVVRETAVIVEHLRKLKS